MQRFLSKILTEAVGPGTEPLPVRMFRLVAFFTGVLSLGVFWLVNLFEPDVPGSVNLVIIGLGVVALGIHWESRRGRHHVGLLLATITLAMDYVWFAKGGFRGDIPLFYPTLSVLPLILYTNWRRWLAVGLIGVNFGGLWLLTVWFPQWIVTLRDPAEFNLDIGASMFCNCLALAIILAILMYNYRQEREVIAASEIKYRQLFENMTVGLALHEVVCDPNGRPADYRFLAVNPAFEKLTGISAATILGKTIREVKPDTEDYWIEVFGSVALTGVPRAYMNYSRELGRYYDTWTFQTGPGGFAVIFSDVTEKKLAEIKIQQQARLLDEAKDAIAVIGLEGKFTYVNEAWGRMHGYKKEELIGQQLAIVHTPEQFKKCEHINDEVARLGRVQSETGHKRKDDSTFPVWLSVSEVHDTEGRLTGYLGIANDITEQKRITQTLIQTRAYYQSLLATASDGIHILDRTGNLVEASASFYRMLGHDPDQPPPLHVSDWDAQWSAPELGERMEWHLREPSVFETIHRRVNGERFPVEISVRGVTIDGRQLIYGASRDITERKKAEEKIREQARLIDLATESIVVRDLQGFILLWNRGAEAMLGWSAAEAIGQRGEPPGSEEFTEFGEALALVTTKGAWSGDFAIKAKDGRILEIASRWTLLRDEQGRPQKILSISHDITSQKKMEAQLLRTERLQIIGRLASGVAHDLNNIFSPFLSGLPILRAEIRTEEARELLNLMERSIRRGADIVRQLLLFGRGGDTKRLPVNLAQPLDDLAKIIRETFPKNLLLSVAYPADLWQVLGDATQIYQIFLNVAVNARDAMPRGGTLTMTAENVRLDEALLPLATKAEPGPYVVLTVRDNGMGMRPEVLERVFEPFFTTKETGQGNGLGLSVALGVVETHGGFIQVQSNPGAGTEFKIHLPALPGVPGATPVAVNDPATNLVAGQGELVLLVDDEAAILKVVSKILERYGYPTLVAANGAEAVTVFQQHQARIRVVITDYSMPGMNGFMLAETLIKLQAGVRIILSSGLGETFEEEQLRRAGIEQVLNKPYDTATLLKILKNIFQRKDGGG